MPDRGDAMKMRLRLRAKALDAVALGLPAPPPQHPNVCGAVVDIEADGERFATLVAMGEGSTSLYTSGQVFIGGGKHAVVRQATHAFLAELANHLARGEPDPDGAFPPPGIVRFHVLTPDARLFLDMPQSEFLGTAPMTEPDLVMAAHAVVTALRAAAQARSSGGS